MVTDAKSGMCVLQGRAQTCANDLGVERHEVEAVPGNVPPQVSFSDDLEAAQWFHRLWLWAQLQGACAVPCCAVLCSVMLMCALQWCAVLCCAIPGCTVP